MHPNRDEAKHTLKEQLRLFAYDGSEASPLVMESIRHGLSKREQLTALLEVELNFYGEDSGYASHDLRALLVG